MKKKLLYLMIGLSLFAGLQAMDVEQASKGDLTQVFNVTARAKEDGIDLNYYDALKIANLRLLSPFVQALDTNNPWELQSYAADNNLVIIDLDEAQSIIEKTFLSDLKNPLDILAKAKELGIKITYNDALRIARRAWFLETFAAWVDPKEIMARALEIGYPMTNDEAKSLSKDLFEMRISFE